MSAPLVGVLALQGDFEAHARMLRGLGAEVREVRVPADLEGLDGLVMPGGESTTMTLGIAREGLADPLRALVRSGTPVLGTCAGLIMLDREHLGLADYTAKRNAFGRQVRSFEADLEIPGVNGGPVRAVFIRAPWIDEHGDAVEVLAEVDGFFFFFADYTAKRNAFGRQVRSFEADLAIPGVDGGPVRAVFIRAPWIDEHGDALEVLAEVDGHVVAARQDNMLVISFHPEIAGEDRLHALFLEASAPALSGNAPTRARMSKPVPPVRGVHMGKITAITFITLDNVVEEPHLWSGAFQSEDTGELNQDVLAEHDALLLGRVTYEGFADAWPSRSGDPFSDKFNAMPKYVVSSTLERADWNNSTIIAEAYAERAAQLKQDQNLLVWGSSTLIGGLLDAGLLDELHLLVSPIVRGEGIRLFRDATRQHDLRVTDSTLLGGGMLSLRLTPQAA